MGIAVLIFGVCGLFLGGIPVLGIILKILAIVGVILGCIVVIKTEKQALALPLAGLILCVVFLISGSIFGGGGLSSVLYGLF